VWSANSGLYALCIFYLFRLSNLCEQRTKAFFDQKLIVGGDQRKVVLDESGFRAYCVNVDWGLNFLSVAVRQSAPEPTVEIPATSVAPSRSSSKKGVRTIPRRRVTSVEKSPSGRERHDEKITVYLSADELFDLDQARLMLRGDLGLAVDRGRIVRESITVIVADLEAKGDQSIFARRLRKQ